MVDAIGTHEEFRLEGVWLPGQAQPVDIAVAGGRIASIDPAAGRSEGVVLPLMSDIHVHLDKAYTIERTNGPVSGLFDAIELMARDKRNWTPEDIRTRASRALEAAYRNGVRAMRSHVDWNEPVIPVAWPVLNELREEWRGRVELQLSSLCPADLLPEAAKTIAARVRDDGGVFGAFFYRNADLAAKVDLAFRAAVENGLSLDFHVDEGLDVEADGFSEIVAAALRHDMAGKVVCGHACSLSLRDDDTLERTLVAAAEAGVALTALPTTNLYLQDRVGGRSPRRRGIAPMKEARAAGMTVMLGVDNCRDAFYPYGDFDPLAVLRLAAIAAHVEPAEWLDAITGLPAGFCGVPARAIAVGEMADFIWFDASDLSDLVSRPDAARTVFRAGRPIDQPSRRPS
ncbi:amidohydrolase family protein [Mesorhizobium sp. 1B3]|uniref:amidohydrolase family protein n=1 Tax=Mesorhizobium sp. 1B3 TaxID=3243599 RepID=UPI003D96B20D